MQNYTIISYATKNQMYLDYATNLTQLFADYNITNYNIHFYPFVSSKMEGCLLKPSFILDELLTRKQPVLCMDIDSVITDSPSPMDRLNKFDIGLVFTPERKNKISNGIHLYNYTNNAINFLNYWDKLCKNPKLKTLDHYRLIDTYNEYCDKIDIINIRKYVKHWFVAQFSRTDSKLYF